MPIVAHNDLPSFTRLSQEGVNVLPSNRALAQTIRELHIGLLNMMPDKALQVTERQFLRLVGESNPIAQFYVHPFTLPELARGVEAQQHIDQHYDTFEVLREQGLDGLIITGANVIGSELADQPFWRPLIEIIDWAADNVTSTLCSCLASHAVLQFRYGQKRQSQPQKTWGVFSHRVLDKQHPLVNDVNTCFDAPHSRWNAVTPAQFEQARLRILAQSEQVGVHLATSPDGLRFILAQGHPEYDTTSLLKEFKREVTRFITGEIDVFPPFVEHYFSSRSKAIIREYQEYLQSNSKPPEFPEALLVPELDNTWHDTAKAIISNWMGLIYQLTHDNRRLPFMDGVDPDNPLVGCY
jgi:homoserine O-succinyltransferase